MTWRFHFTKRAGMGSHGKGLAERYQRFRAIVPERSPGVNTQKHQCSEVPR